MFRSIRWRLVASYVLLTLLTVSVLGILGFSLVRQYVLQQETEFLSSNAEAVAQQAEPLMSSHIDRSDLLELATAASFLGNIRVRILDSSHMLLVDSGQSTGIDQFLWIRSTGKYEGSDPKTKPYETFILFPYSFEFDQSSMLEIPFDFLEGFPQETQYRFVQRMVHPWGTRVLFDQPSEQFLDEKLMRSSRIFTFPVGEADDPVGYVELRDGPSFVSEALKTTARAFFIAAMGALVLAGAVGLLMARRLTSPLIQLAGAAGQMSEGNLSVRAPEFGRDEIGQLACQFNQMAERLEASFVQLATERDTLRRFITDASHELRTPITALKNFIELLQGKARDDPQARAEFLAESESQLNRLEWITNNLLNISRLEAGLTPLKWETIETRKLIESVVAPFRMQAEEKGITVMVHDPQPIFEFYADRALMELALSNLLDNALKFTPNDGQVKLGANQTPDTVRLWVRDNGVGIDPEDLPHIFERFYRGRGAVVEGSGLGLAMVESVVQAHAGRVSVDSELGAGSQFVIELPRDIMAVIGAQSHTDATETEVGVN